MSDAPILVDPPNGNPSSDVISAAVDDGTYMFVSGTVGHALDGQPGFDDPEFPVPMAIAIQTQTTRPTVQAGLIGSMVVEIEYLARHSNR